jgi:hypothetical protein
MAMRKRMQAAQHAAKWTAIASSIFKNAFWVKR